LQEFLQFPMFATHDIDQRRWLRLPDGRRLAYTATGPRRGRPVLYCHGAIGSPLGASCELERITADLDVLHIALNRPGTGGSDPDLGRTILSFADDVRAVADELGVTELDVVGVSAGGPYALAAAFALPSLVQRVAVVSSLSPLCALHRTPGMGRQIRLSLAALARAPKTIGALGDGLLPIVEAHPRLISKVISAHAAPAERERLADPCESTAAIDSFLAAAEGGVRGMISDYLTYSGEWGFDVREVTQRVQLWHGVGDPLVPVEHALQLAVTLPDCRVFLDPEEGHHFFRRRLDSILAALVDGVPGVEAEAALAHVRALERAPERRPERRALRGRAQVGERRTLDRLAH
jgi:pimeloyl-ACP methyl ester carboxylesterase